MDSNVLPHLSHAHRIRQHVCRILLASNLAGFRKKSLRPRASSAHKNLTSKRRTLPRPAGSHQIRRPNTYPQVASKRHQRQAFFGRFDKSVVLRLTDRHCNGHLSAALRRFTVPPSTPDHTATGGSSRPSTRCPIRDRKRRRPRFRWNCRDRFFQTSFGYITRYPAMRVIRAPHLNIWVFDLCVERPVFDVFPLPGQHHGTPSGVQKNVHDKNFQIQNTDGSQSCFWVLQRILNDGSSKIFRSLHRATSVVVLLFLRQDQAATTRKNTRTERRSTFRQSLTKLKKLLPRKCATSVSRFSSSGASARKRQLLMEEASERLK